MSGACNATAAWNSRARPGVLHPMWFTLVTLLACTMGLFTGCATTAAPVDSTAPAQSPADERGPDWAAVVAAEQGRLESEFGADASVRIVVLDMQGQLLARSGAIDAPLPTGSSVKPLMTLAALQQGVSPDMALDCEGGEFEVDGVLFYDAKPRGTISLARAIADSSNVAMVKLALEVGWEPLYDAVSSWVSLPERGGLSRPEGIALLFGATTTLGLQELARAYAAIPAMEHGDEMLGMLALAVADGTATRAARPGVFVAGKTGTAVIDDRYHAVFVAFVGTAAPEVVVAVAVDGLEPQGDYYGSTVAAPAVGNMAEAIYAAGSNTAP